MDTSPTAIGRAHRQGRQCRRQAALLKLEPNQTCGFVRVTYVSKLTIAPGGLPAPFADGRPAGSALYFLMTPQAPVKLHRIRNEQLYHYYLGDPIEVLMLHAEELAAKHPDVAAEIRSFPLPAS